MLLSCVLFSELAKFGQGRGGFAGVDGFGAEGYAFFEIGGEVGGDEGGGGVEQDDVAAGAFDAGDARRRAAPCWLRCRRR